MTVRCKHAIAGAAFLTVFFIGFALSVQLHGDWLIIRSANDQCVAYDPDQHSPIGSWSTSRDGRCHMQAFIWRRLFDL